MKKTRVHVYPTGRLGNQLYFAAAALVWRDLLIAQNKKPMIIFHKSAYLPELNYLTGMIPDKICEDRFLNLLIGEKPLQERHLILRAFYKLYLTLISIRTLDCSFFETTDSKVSRKNLRISSSLNDYRFYQRSSESMRNHQESIRIENEKIIDLDIDFQHFIAVHMRFGDFLSNNVADLYGNLHDRYYLNAIKELSESRPFEEISVVLFTDDISKGREALERIGVKTVIILPPERFSPAQELFLLSRFKKIIVSNSTFSWWAGYFAEDLSYVIAPDPLYKNLNTNLSRSPNWYYRDGWG